jgi:hypothetical protein
MQPEPAHGPELVQPPAVEPVQAHVETEAIQPESQHAAPEPIHNLAPEPINNLAPEPIQHDDPAPETYAEPHIEPARLPSSPPRPPRSPGRPALAAVPSHEHEHTADDYASDDAYDYSETREGDEYDYSDSPQYDARTPAY